MFACEGRNTRRASVGSVVVFLVAAEIARDEVKHTVTDLGTIPGGGLGSQAGAEGSVVDDCRQTLPKLPKLNQPSARREVGGFVAIAGSPLWG
jgi:hypothetical protein